MMEGFGEIMTLEETAKYLKIGKSTLFVNVKEFSQCRGKVISQ